LLISKNIYSSFKKRRPIMSELYEKMSAANTFQEKAQVVWDHYLSRKLPIPEPGVFSLEPNWVHSGYELVDRYLKQENLDANDQQLLQQIIESHSLKDGFEVSAFPGQPASPIRIIHDGWKAGTPTWIFMGRSFKSEVVLKNEEVELSHRRYNEHSVVHLGGGWIAVHRTIPEELYKKMDKEAAPRTLWMAYNENEQMGVTALTSNVIGPATSFNQLWEEVNDAYGPLYSISPRIVDVK
jgi:hypothetical protein